MAVDKISELVDPKVYADLDKLEQKLTSNVAAMLEAIETANQYNQALGRAASPRDFVDRQTAAATAISRVESANERARLSEIRLQQAREAAFDRYERRLQQQAESEARQESQRQRSEQSEQRRQQAAEARDARTRARLLEQSGAYGTLKLRLDEATKAAQNIGIAFGADSPQFKTAETQVRAIYAQLEAVDNRLGRFNRNVGNYASAFNGLGNSVQQVARELPALGINLQTFFLAISNNLPILFDEISKLSAANKAAQADSQIAAAAASEQAVAQARLAGATEAAALAQGELAAATTLATAAQGRQTVGQALLRSIFSLQTALVVGVTLLVLYGKEIANLGKELFNGGKSIDEFKLKNDLLTKSLQSDTLKNAVAEVSELRLNIDQAKQGFIDKDRVVKQYNDTIGKTTGQVTTLDEAERQLSKNATEYIRFTLLKATAQSALQEAAKRALDAQVEQNRQESGFLEQQVNSFKKVFQGIGNEALGGSFDNNNKTLAQRREDNKKANIKALNDEGAAYSKIASDLTTNAAKLSKALGFNFFGDNATSSTGTAIDELNKNLLERSIQTNEAIVADDKRSYSARRIAAMQLFNDQSDLIKKNAADQIAASKNATETANITYKATTDLLKAQSEYNDKIKDLTSDETKDSIDKQKQRLENRKAAAAIVYEDERNNYAVRTAALQSFAKTSKRIIDLQAREEIEQAGANSDKVAKIKEEQAGKITKLNNDVDKARDDIQKDTNAKYAKEQEELYKLLTQREKELLLSYEAASAERLSVIEKEKRDYIANIVDQYDKGLISGGEYNQKLFDVEQATAAKINELRIAALRKAIETQAAALALGIGSAEDLQKSIDALNKLEADSDTSKTKIIVDNAKKREDAAQKLKDKLIEVGQAALDLGQAITNGIFQSQQDALKQQGDALDKQTEREKEAIDRSLLSNQQKAEKQAQLDEQSQSKKAALDEKARDLARQQAIADKAFTAARIIGQTAVAVTSALAPPPIGLGPIAGIPLAVATGAFGALQLATVLATPIPKFRSGVSNFRGGDAIVGDGGAEIVRTPDGRMALSPATDTFVNLPAGSTVFNNAETMRILAKPDVHVERSRTEQGWGLVVNAVERTGKQTVKAVSSARSSTISGWMKETKNADKWARRERNHFR